MSKYLSNQDMTVNGDIYVQGSDKSAAPVKVITSAGVVATTAAVTATDFTATGNTALGNAVTDTTTIIGATTIQTSAAAGLAVGLAAAGANPAFVVDSSTGSQAAGLKVTGATAAGTVAAAVISSGADANLTLNAKGSGTIGIGSVSTGAVTITPATTITGAATHSSTTALVGATTVTATAGIVSTVNASEMVPFIYVGAADTTAPASAIPLTNYYSKLDSNAGATTQTLAASTCKGQLKKIQMIVDGGDDVVTVTSLSGGTTITFADVGDFVLLCWNGSNWIILEAGNDADGVTAPAVA